MIDLPLSNANIPYPDFVLHTVIDPDKFDLNNAELQGKLNATIGQVNTNTTTLTLKSDKTYVDTQDTNLQNQINAHTTTLGTKADKTYVDSQNATQDTTISGHTSTLASYGTRITTAESDILLRTVKTGDHPGTWQSKNISYFDNQIATKANQSTTYTKVEVDNLLTPKANQSTTYTKTETDNLLAPKATTVYVDNGLALKANQTTTYTKTEVDNLVNPKASVTYVDTQLALKANTSSVYTQAQLNNSTAGSDGATLIGSAPITGVTGTTVQAKLSSLKTLIDAVSAGGVPDGSITPVKLDRAYLQLTAGGTVAGLTNFTGGIQESGTALASKYAPINNATHTGTLTAPTINATTSLQEGGVAISSKYLALTGGTLTSDLIITKSTATGSISVGSTLDDARYKIFTASGKIFFQTGNEAWSSFKDLEIGGYNAFNIPTLTLRATSTVATGTVQGTTINATANLQEAGTNLSAKYLALAGGTLTGALTLNTSANLTANGTNTFGGSTTFNNSAIFSNTTGTALTLSKVNPSILFNDTNAGGGNMAIANTASKLSFRWGADNSANEIMYLDGTTGLNFKPSLAYTGGGTLGQASIHMKNSDIIGMNGNYFNDTCDSEGEGLNFPKTGAVAGSTTQADYNCLRVDGAGTLKLGGQPLVQSGVASVTPVANTPTAVTVTFPIAFTAPPIVTVSAISAVPGTQVTGVSVNTITATTVQIYVTRTNTNATQVNWIAVSQ